MSLFQVFQSRQDGSVDFYRGWKDYKNGFGDLNGEFWLGNENIYLMTKNRDRKLKIELTYGQEVAYANYNAFSVGNEYQKYKLFLEFPRTGSPPGKIALQ